jgi:WD40 repeat protein
MKGSNPKPNPYVGPRAFKTGEKLYGRNREEREIQDLLIAERIVLLHSPSGAGKSSLVHAGLIPQLIDNGFLVYPVARVNQEPPPDIVKGEKFNRYVFSVLLSLEEALPEDQRTPVEKLVSIDLENYLTEYLPKIQNPDEANKDSVVLIFDQFEEVLTVDSTDREEKLDFFSQLGTALRDRRRWTLFVMREDYLPALDPFVRPLPTRLTNTYRLDFLVVDAARQAIHQPAHEVGVHFSYPAVSKLINDLRLVQVQQPDGSMNVVPGPYVEPVQLQVVCSNLWNHLPDDIEQITEKEISAVGNVDQSLSEYYAERVAVIARQTGVHEREIREWFDHHLITETGIRGQVLMGKGESEGVSNETIRQLEDTHLVRAEKRLGATWFELAHDRLIQPIRTNNAAWFQENLSLLQRQASLWDQQNRSETLYLRDKPLEIAEQWAAQHPDELSDIDQQFLANCQEQRARENAAREAAERERQLKLEAAQQLAEEQVRAATRVRRVAYALAIVLVIAIGLAIAAYLAQSLASQNAKIANQQRTTAQAASTQAYKNATQAQANAEKAMGAEQLANQNAEKAKNNAATAQSASTEAVAQKATAVFNFELAKTQEARALTQANLARSRELASLALSFLKDNSVLTLLLGKEAMDVSDTGQALDALLRGLQRNLFRQSKRYDQFIPRQEVDIYTLSASPDGRRIAWAGPEGFIRIWDLEAQKEEQTIYMNGGFTVNALAFSHDSKILYSADAGGNIASWDVESGHILKDYTADINYVTGINSLALSPDGTTLAYGGSTGGDTNVYTRNLETGFLQSFRFSRGGIEDTLAVAWSPDGKILASAGRDRAIHIWDSQTGREINTIRTVIEDNTPIEVYGGPIHSLAFSPNGKWLVSGGEDNLSGVKDKTLMMWDTSSWSDPYQQPVIFKGGPNSDINVIKFSPDGLTLATAYNNGQIATWNFNSQNLNELISANTGSVLAMDFSQFEKSLLLISSGFDRTIVMNNLVAQDTLNSLLVEGKGNPTRLAVSGNDQLTIAGTTDAGLATWELDPSTGQNHPVDSGLPTKASNFYIGPDGSHIAVISPEDGIEIRQLGSQQVVTTIPIPTVAISVTNAQGVQSMQEEPGEIDALALNLKDDTLAGAYCDRRSQETKPGTNDVINTCLDREILIWGIPSGEIEKRISTGQSGAIRSLAFKPDDMNTLAVGYQNASIRFWDIEQARASGLPLIGLGGPVTSLAFHRDGDVLASGSENKLIALWNMNPPQLIGDPFTGADGAVTSLAFSSDNSILFSGTDAGTIASWNIEEWKQLACRLAGRNLTQAEWEQFFPSDSYRATCEQHPLQTSAADITVSPAAPTSSATGTPIPAP